MRLRQWLIGLIVLEVALGGAALAWRASQRQPPTPLQTAFDPLTTAELSQRAHRTITPGGWRELGELYTALGYYREAEACYRFAAESNGADSRTLYDWAFVLERCGETETAIDVYSRAAKASPQLAPACHYAVGRNFLRQEDLVAAEDAFQRCGDLPAARFQLARLYVRSKQLSQAEELARDLAAQFPEAQDPHRLLYQIGLAANDLGQAEEHADLQDRLPDLLPTPMDDDRQWLLAARETIGLVALRAKARQALDAHDFQTARKYLEQAIAARADLMAEDLLAEVAFQEGRLDDCAARLEKLLDRYGPTPHHWERLGDTYHAQKRKADARAAWQRACLLADWSTARGAHRKLAVYAQGSAQGAEANRQFAMANLGDGIHAFRAGDMPQAASKFLEAAKQDPQLPSLWYYMGETARVGGDAAAARQAYERCLGLSPSHGRAAERLAWLAD